MGVHTGVTIGWQRTGGLRLCLHITAGSGPFHACECGHEALGGAGSLHTDTRCVCAAVCGAAHEMHTHAQSTTTDSTRERGVLLAYICFSLHTTLLPTQPAEGPNPVTARQAGWQQSVGGRWPLAMQPWLAHAHGVSVVLTPLRHRHVATTAGACADDGAPVWHYLCDMD